MLEILLKWRVHSLDLGSYVAKTRPNRQSQVVDWGKTPETDPPFPTHKVYDYIQPVPDVKPPKEFNYDPHLDPQLVWAGKKEHVSFEVPTVSLHVHETIDPRTIIAAVRKHNGNSGPYSDI